MEKKYVKHLKQIIGTPRGKSYSFLIDALWRKEFYSRVLLDENRVNDAYYLREVLGYSVPVLGQARCLEILFILSRKAEFELSGTGTNFRNLFWEFVENLGLKQYSDDAWDDPQVIFEVDRILIDWLDRRHSKSGLGGVFPLKDPEKDQRDVELWYQLNAWVLEKGFF
jgi:hypothetical protein